MEKLATLDQLRNRCSLTPLGWPRRTCFTQRLLLDWTVNFEWCCKMQAIVAYDGPALVSKNGFLKQAAA